MNIILGGFGNWRKWKELLVMFWDYILFTNYDYGVLTCICFFCFWLTNTLALVWKGNTAYSRNGLSVMAIWSMIILMVLQLVQFLLDLLHYKLNLQVFVMVLLLSLLFLDLVVVYDVLRSKPNQDIKLIHQFKKFC